MSVGKKNTKKPGLLAGLFEPGATGRIRTGDLLITSELLYRLSHSSKLLRANRQGRSESEKYPQIP